MARENTSNSGRRRETSALQVRHHLPWDAYGRSFLEFAVHAGLWRRRLPRSIPQLLILLAAANMLGAGESHASTLRVPGDFPTIQSAIQAAAADDTILVGPGTYPENLDTLGKRLILIGEVGAANTIIDGRGLGRVLRMTGGGIVEGFTMTRGSVYEASGGGLYVDGPELTIVRNNVISNCVSGYTDVGNGGGVYLNTESNAIIESNEIRDNYAGYAGGGICDYGAYARNIARNNVISGNGVHVTGGGTWGLHEFTGNLVIGNWSDFLVQAAGVKGAAQIHNNTIVGNRGTGVEADGLIMANIVVGNQGGGIRACGDRSGYLTLECNDSWGNSGGDYIIYAPCDSTGGRNFSADPLFCGYPGDYRISADSPCAPGGNEGCGLVGAFPIGCGATAVQPSTWGSIKAHFR